ncbi:MAG TPA: hypothetical protein VHS27_20650 [Gaiellales bacterium]|jgi:hypothetical protein|nr:hypothetical protein [Gaiellales bacterium]
MSSTPRDGRPARGRRTAPWASSQRRDLQEQLGERYREAGLARRREAAESAYRRFAFGETA